MHPLPLKNTRWRQFRSELGFGGCLAVLMATAPLAVIDWSALSAVAQTQSETLTVTLISSRAIVFNPITRKVYAVDRNRDAVSIFDPRTASTSSVKVGAAPVAIAMNPVNGRVYVANAGAGTVSVLDAAKEVVVATVRVGNNPYVLAVNERTNKIYVSRTFSDLLTVIDGATDATTTVKTGSADAIAIDSKANKIYLLGYENNDITVLDGANGSLTKLTVGMHPWGMIHNEANGVLYVTRAGSAELVTVDERSHVSNTIATGAIPCAVGLNPVTNVVYVVNYGDNTVTVIDGAKQRVVKTLSVGEHPQAVAVDPSSNLIYVVNTHGNSVTVIDGTKNTIRGTLNAGEHPYAIALDPTGDKLYIASLGEPLTVVDARRPVPVTARAVNRAPRQTAAKP
jgi:YVTN family beta-propeller protein